MCIAILNISSQLTEETLKNSWNNNEQGAGLLWNEAGQLQTFKTYKFKELLKKYNKLRSNPIIGKIVLHFRIATSGYEKYTNLHPFKVNDSLGFVHNGVISGLGDNRYSDTYYFNELLKSLPNNFIRCHSTLELIAGYIGSSKLIFLDSEDNHTIINEAKGNWIDDNWFSNDSHTCNLDFYYYGNEKVSKSRTTFDDLEWNDYSGYYNTYDVVKENRDYLTTFWDNTDDFTINKALTLIGESLTNFKMYETFEDLSYQFNTTDLLQLIRKIETN